MNIKKAKITFDAQEGEVELLVFAAQAWGLSYLFLLLKPEACVTIQLFYRIFCKSCIFQRRD